MWSYDVDRGLCFFQVVLVDEEKQTARASLDQVLRAASALILRCAAGAESEGGVAKNIGNAFLSFHPLQGHPPHPRKERRSNSADT